MKMWIWNKILRWVLPGAMVEATPKPVMTDDQLTLALRNIQIGDQKVRAIVEMALARAASAYVMATRVDLSAEQRNWYLASSAALHQLVQDVLSGTE